MKIKYRNPGDKYSTDSIIEFMREGEFWTEPIFHFYPDLMKHEKTFIKDSHREEKLRQEILNIYENRKVEIEAKVLSYQEAWDLHEMMINESFSNIFQLNSSIIFNDFVSNISLNPISPRYLKEKVFDVFYMNSPSGSLGSALHEITHFLWFYLWNTKYKDDYSNY